MGIRDIPNRFTSVLDDATPVYKRARDGYAFGARMMESLQPGLGFMPGDPYEIAADGANAPKSEFEAIR
jgi:hypothetical protein